jgi:averantin hydroxylase
MRYAHEAYGTADGLTFQEICEQAGLLIIAGSITTGTLMAGATYLLLSNPPVLAKITYLIRSAFESESEINSVTVNQIDYLLAIINEALRLYPPVTGSFARVTPSEGCVIAGAFVPGKTCVAVNQWAASRSSANFVRPNEFIPERWMGEPEFDNDKRKAVQPFSVGPRNCLGRNLAYMEVKIVLARVLWNFDMELCEESRGWMERQKYWAIADRPELMVRLKPVARV